MSYIQNVLGDVPQTQQAEANQVPNSGGGYTFTLTPLKRLERFLILGSDAPTYYASAQKLTRENALCVIECWKHSPKETVSAIVSVSMAGRAPKNDAAVFAVALGLASDSTDARMLAKDIVNVVCRTGTHLFQLVDAVDKLRGWGRGLRSTIARWYAGKSADDAAYQVIKYQSRDKWSHRDVLRLVHPKAPSPQHAALYRWIVGASPAERNLVRTRHESSGPVAVVTKYPEVGKENIPKLVIGYERAKLAKTAEEVVALVDEYGLTHEMIPGDWKSKNEIWAKLAEKMPLHALVRNLGNLTARGILAPLSDATVRACALLTNGEALKKARMHPMTVLMAQRQYRSGQGDKGKLTWLPIPAIIEALEKAFYASFAAVEPTGKRILIALDVSGSMIGYPYSGNASKPSPRELSACLAMVTMRTEQNWHVVGFSSGLSRLGITPSMSLADVCSYTAGLPFSGTDCALPMLWAMHSNTPVDTFVVITDNETNQSSVHPHIALQQYRKAVNPQAKLAVIAMTATNFTIAHPDDAGMLDFVGMDSSGPQVLADFIRS